MIGNDIFEAVKVLNKNELIGLPTETVYGLAGNALSVEAVQKIYSLKNRPNNNPLILHTHSLDAALKYTKEFVPAAIKLAESFWPGPLTLLLPKQSIVPDSVTSGSHLVAVRVPNHPVALKLLKALNYPLVAPSANPYTRISPTNAQMVDAYFGKGLPYILEGGSCSKGIESTIVGFEDGLPIVFRQGAISIDALEFVVGKVKLKHEVSRTLVTPGMAKLHYAPRTSMFIVDDLLDFIQAHPNSKIGFIGMGDRYLCHPNIEFVTLTESNDLEEASANLYQSMYYLDGLNLDCIVIKKFPEMGIGRSLNDRITRATFIQ
jgi:L-threonylcarbamoyladenylate synthase